MGVHNYHTPEFLIDYFKSRFEKLKYSVAINEPFAGAIVPLLCYGKEKSVGSLMLEIEI